MPLLITEILEVARQGKTKPIFCKAEDGNMYVTKGDYAGKKALASEWMAGQLGQDFGLPIPSLALLQVTEPFFQFSGKREELQILGRGTLFGSLWQENLVEIRHSNLAQINEMERARLLAFDWWVGNEDRTLTELGGNPNLLWSDANARLTVIDHHLAFEYEDLGAFWQNHIFREDKRLWIPAFRREMETNFRAGLAKLDALWQTIPEDWLESLTDLSLPYLRANLSRFETDPASFWGQL
jgi:hypothetical protein